MNPRSFKDSMFARVVAITLAIAAGLVAIAGQPAGAQTAATAPTSMVVEPYYLVPSDLAVRPEYQAAIGRYLDELRSWYSARVGRPFAVTTLRTVRGPRYETMRCGSQPTQACRSDRNSVPNWWGSVQSVVPPTSFAIKLVFSQGGGGFAGGSLWGQLSGYAVVGDWVLEPISGLRDPAVIHCGYATWQCSGGVPKGTVAHELGHAFGLHHPLASEPGRLIMRWHGDYPDAGFRPHEVAVLRNNPYFDRPKWSDGPWLGYNAPDEQPRAGRSTCRPPACKHRTASTSCTVLGSWRSPPPSPLATRG